MAQSNSFFGLRTGSTKNFTFAIQDGKQITKEKAASVTNPNTTSQQATRAAWAYASKFYAKAEQNLFRFAYEDQADGENDFNAFMRHNSEIAPFASRKMLDDMKTPWFGPWMMSYGSLRSIDDNIEWQENGDVRMFMFTYGIPFSQITLAQLSESLKEDYPVKEGDIVTFGVIQSSGTTTPVESIEEALLREALTFDNETAPAWKMSQITVSTSEGAEQILLKDCTNLQEVTIGNSKYAGYHTTGTNPRGAFMILSRKEEGKLKVSTNFIILSAYSKYAYDVGVSSAWREFCNGESTGTGTFGPAKASAVLEGGDSSYQNEYENGYKYHNVMTRREDYGSSGIEASGASFQFELDHIDKAFLIQQNLKCVMSKVEEVGGLRVSEVLSFRALTEVTGKPYRYIAYLQIYNGVSHTNIAELHIMGERVDAFEIVFADELSTYFVDKFEWWDTRPVRKKAW